MLTEEVSSPSIPQSYYILPEFSNVNELLAIRADFFSDISNVTLYKFTTESTEESRILIAFILSLCPLCPLWLKKSFHKLHGFPSLRLCALAYLR